MVVGPIQACHLHGRAAESYSDPIVNVEMSHAALYFSFFFNIITSCILPSIICFFPSSLPLIIIIFLALR